MSTLTGVNAVVGQPGFYDDAGGRDVGPFYGNAQPRVTAAPAPRADEDVVASQVEELLVLLFYLAGNFRIAGGTVVLCLDVDHVEYVVHDAMSQ